FVTDHNPFIDDVAMERGRDLVTPDSFGLVRLAVALLVGLGVVGVDRPDGVARDDANPGILFLEVLTGAADGAAGPRGTDEMRHSAVGLRPDLGSGRVVVHFRIDRIVVLIGKDGVVVRRGDRAALHDIVVGIVGRHGGRRDDDFGTQGAKQPRFFL